MANFVQGDVVTLTFDQNDEFKFTGRGSAVITPGSGAIGTAVFRLAVDNSTLGPFHMNGTLVFTATTNGSYLSSNYDDPAPTYVTSSTDPVTGRISNLTAGSRFPLADIAPSSCRTVAFFGDSLTNANGQAIQYGYRITATVNGFTSANWVILYADPETPSGDGSWVYNSSAKTCTWAAFGETAGVAVDVSSAGVFYLPSSVAGHGLTVVFDSVNTAVAGGTTTVTVPANGNQVQALYCARGFAPTALAIAGPHWEIKKTTVYPYGIALGGVPGLGAASLASSATQAAGILADVDIIQIGTNDIQNAGAFTTITTGISAFVASRKTSGTARIGVCTIQPKTSNTATHNKIRSQVNRWIRDYAKTIPGVTCLDINAAVQDTATGGWLSGFAASDGVHPSNTGAWAIAKVVAAYLTALSPAETFYPDFNDVYDATNNPYGAIIGGTGYLSFEGSAGTTGTGASGTIPSNHTLSRKSGAAMTLAGAKVARTDNVGGSWYQVTLASAAASEYGELDNQGHPYTLGTYGLAVGDSIEAWVEINVASSTSLSRLDFLISFGGVAAGSRKIQAFSDPLNSGTVLQDAMGRIWLRTPVATIPVGATNLSWTFRMGTESGGAAVIQLGRWSVNKVRII
jgi:lysophospholipase L1-like esterase